jgi:hypothetical protein
LGSGIDVDLEAKLVLLVRLIMPPGFANPVTSPTVKVLELLELARILGYHLFSSAVITVMEAVASDTFCLCPVAPCTKSISTFIRSSRFKSMTSGGGRVL